jgi:ribonuclease BN (tRNA processing enzyme)
MLIRFWGTRGSIASPGAHTVRYGGNTTCIEVESSDGGRIVVDAGTGARLLGARLLSDHPNGGKVNLLLSHAHWDHVQGLPFFGPLRDAGSQVHLYVPQHMIGEASRILKTQLDPLFFPLAPTDMKANIRVDGVGERAVIDGFIVRSASVRHPGGAVAYRIEDGNDPARSVVIAPDSELDGGSTDSTPLSSLAHGARVLVHDAMYNEEEYTSRRGWGHSTHHAALKLALQCGVRVLVLFHHDPDRSDAGVDAMLEECRSSCAEQGGDLQVVAAREGMEISV